jgi:glycosyltransferase involved in cell wall biosynthesis
MPPLRVVMLSKALVVGSYQRKAELLAAGGGLDLTVVVPPLWRDGTLVRRLERAHVDGYHLVETPIVRPGDFHLHFYPRFGRVLDAARPDIVHVDEEPYNLATFLALVEARRRGARTLFFTWQNLDRRYPPPFRWFERYAHTHVDSAIAGSRTAGEVLRAKGYTGPLWHIPQVGVDPDVYRPADATPGPRPLVVGFAGRLVRGKGVDLLIEALSALEGDWRLDVLGDGPELDGLQSLARARGVDARVTWTPWRPSAAMPDHYRSLDVLVLPSRSTPTWIEQFGRVLTEAMACGVPCVGSDSGEIPHVLGEAGLVFREDDVDGLRAALAALAGSADLRARLGAAGRTRVLERYTMAAVAADTAHVYDALRRR